MNRKLRNGGLLAAFLLVGASALPISQADVAHDQHDLLVMQHADILVHLLQVGQANPHAGMHLLPPGHPQAGQGPLPQGGCAGETGAGLPSWHPPVAPDADPQVELPQPSQPAIVHL